jgi:RNA-binding protein 26
MRGDMCPYDHGMDRVVVDGNTGPYAGPFPAGGPIPPIGVRTGPPQNFFGGIPGAVPDAYDPERSGIMPNNNMGGGFPNMPPGMMNPNDIMSGGMNSTNNGMMRGNGMRRGTGHRGGRGGRGGYQGHRQHNNPQNTTLNVEKIPAEFCQISTVNDFFAKFGTITNISVQPHAQMAVIQYSTRAEAESAYNSPDAIFDNRFVKVYWRKDDTPAAVAGANAAEVPAAVVPKSNEPDPELVAARAAELAKEREEKQKKHNENLKYILDIQKKKEAQLQQQIDEQKRLLAKLTNSAGMTQAEKAVLLRALKNIQSDIDTSKSAASQPIPAQSTSAAAGSATGQEGGEVKEGAESTAELAKKLAQLEAEVIIQVNLLEFETDFNLILGCYPWYSWFWVPWWSWWLLR